MTFKSLFKSLARPLSPIVGLRDWIQYTGRKLLLPFYHGVSDDALPFVSPLYAHKTVKAFQEEILFLTRYYEPIDFQTLQDHILNRSSISRPVFHLSFDDGLACLFPLKEWLLEKGIPATFFVNSAFVGNQELFYRYKQALLIHQIESSSNQLTKLEQHLKVKGIEALQKAIFSMGYTNQESLVDSAAAIGFSFSEYLQYQQPYMHSAQLLELQRAGFEIGAHSHDHPLFSEITLEAQLHQVQQSLSLLEKIIGTKVRSFAFPFNSDGVNEAVYELLYEQSGVSLSFGTGGFRPADYPRHLHRLPMERHTLTVEQHLKSEYLYSLIRYGRVGQAHD
jgi:peptidoglycan/xylan/chitin deacetylase (PgdA/CDA1 family)